MTRRREFLKGVFASAVAGVPPVLSADMIPPCMEEDFDDDIAHWNEETELVSPKTYAAYLKDGNARGFVALEKLERAFEKVVCEARSATVGDVPCVWSVYNMGYIVKTKESMFSIDLVHRRDVELVPMLDFAFVTHNHGDHWRRGFCKAMANAGKTVVSNFLDNPGFNALKASDRDGSHIYRLRDVEFRTSIIDHNDLQWGINFTMAFEFRIGDWTLYHTGDSGRGTVPKLETVWGSPDLWLFFPGCGIEIDEAVWRVDAKRIVFGHLWELGHKQNHRGRLDERLIRRALALSKPYCPDVEPRFWGDTICPAATGGEKGKKQ